MRVAFGELLGELRQTELASGEAKGALVIRSSISHGGSTGPRWPGLTIRYVGRGIEHYTINGRYYRVCEDQFMVAPQILGSQVEVRRSERENTLGLCVFLPEIGEDLELLLEAPIVISASCDLGRSLRNSLTCINSPQRGLEAPERIACETRAELRNTLAALDRQVESVPGLKRKTRLEAVRKMNLARAYLHQITNRPVSLDELAKEVAVSPFHLLRCFRDCFYETPAAYHRRLRLTLARETAHREDQLLRFVADRFGFAGGDSLSHAHRRAFGHSPSRSLKSPPRS